MQPGKEKRVDYEYIRHGVANIFMANKPYTHIRRIYETFCPDEAKRLIDRFEFINTPKHGNWLNMAEIELHSLNSQCLSRHIATIKEMQEEVMAWQVDRNNKTCKSIGNSQQKMPE
jgi:hypothetical protein